jgi:hypothetical protein
MNPKEALMRAVQIEDPAARVKAVNAWAEAFITRAELEVQIDTDIMLAGDPDALRQRVLTHALQELVVRCVDEAPEQRTLELTNLGAETYRLRFTFLRYYDAVSQSPEDKMSEALVAQLSKNRA